MAAFHTGSELDHSVQLCTPAVIITRREGHQLKKALKLELPKVFISELMVLILIHDCFQ